MKRIMQFRIRTGILFMVICMLLNTQTVSFADDQYFQGSGTDTEPYLISSVEQLVQMSVLINSEIPGYSESNYMLTADIDLGTLSSWTSIGDHTGNVFCGVFDGDGHKINVSGTLVSLDPDSSTEACLFGFNNGTIINLGLTVSDVDISGSADLTYTVAGIARSNGKEGVIADRYNALPVKRRGTNNVYSGGIVIHNNGLIERCYNSGSVYAYGSSTTIIAGGIAARNSSSGIIRNCYNTGTVTSRSASTSEVYTGGIIGRNDNGGVAEYCYNIGIVSGSSEPHTKSDIGGIAGVNYGTQHACFGAGHTGSSGFFTGPVIVKTLDEMKKEETFEGFDFYSVWMIDREDIYGFPQIKDNPMTHQEENTTEFAGGRGTVYDPYKITNTEQLDNIRLAPDRSFCLVNDIVFDAEDFEPGDLYYNEGMFWKPVADTEGAPFIGSFDGKGHSITGLKSAQTGAAGTYTCSGLFGYNFGYITDLRLHDCDIGTGTKSYFDHGGISGVNGGTIQRCYVEGSVQSGRISGYSGGIAGSNYDLGRIINCYNDATVFWSSNDTADRFGPYNVHGGITGINYGYVNKSLNKGTISSTGYFSTSRSGGISGKNYGTISFCGNQGRIEITSSGNVQVFAGGISAQNNKLIRNCYNEADFYIADSGLIELLFGGICGPNSGSIGNCFNTGAIRTDFPGYFGGISSRNNGDVYQCYNSGELAASEGTAAYMAGIVRLNESSISDCYNSGVVAVPSGSAGGITFDNRKTINRCYNSGMITGHTDEAVVNEGAITVKTNTLSDISNCFYLDSTVLHENPNDLDAVSCSHEEMSEQLTFAGYDFNGKWIMDAGEYRMPIIRDLYVPLQSIILEDAVMVTGESAKILQPVPSNASLTDCIWSSSDESVAVAEPDGTIRALSEGSTQISAVSYAGGFIAGCTVIVYQGIEKILIMPEVILDAGESYVLAPEIIPSDSYDQELNWNSSDGSVVSVDTSGQVTAVKSGSALITVSAADGSSVRAYCKVTVRSEVTSISIRGEAPTGIFIGETLSLAIDILPVSASNKNVVWSTSSEYVATVSDEGFVIARHQGTALIRVTAEDGGLYDEALITVLQPVEGIVLIHWSDVVATGGRFRFEALIQPESADYRNVIWSSEDDSIAAVDDDGWVTGVSPGTTQITARSPENDLTVSHTVTVGKGIEKINVITPDEVPYFSEVQLECEVLPADALKKTVSWSVINGTGEASITSNGSLYPRKKGTVTVVVSSYDGTDVVGTAEINIIDPTFTVTFKDWDGRVIKTEDQVIYDTAAIPPDDPVREGHVFTKWSTVYKAIRADLTVYAIYDLPVSDSIIGKFEYRFEGDNAIVVKNTGSRGRVVIPDKIDGHRIIAIDGGAFKELKEVTEIIVPETVSLIGDLAFANCPKLTYVNIPEDVTYIGKGAFRGCSSLPYVDLPDGITEIKEGTFAGCKNMAEIEIPYGVRSIEKAAFAGCANLRQIVLPENVESIGYEAFANCTFLERIEIPAGVESIGERAFMYCSSLTDIRISDLNAYYSSSGGALFNKDKSELICYQSVMSDEYIVPDSVVRIADRAFYDNNGLSRIVFGQSVVEIGKQAVAECLKLKSVTLPDSLMYIGDGAFSSCSSLTAVDIPASVESIGKEAFTICTSVREFKVDPENAFYRSIDGVLFSKDGKRLLCYPGGRQGGYEIPSGTEVIGNNAFINSPYLSEICIPNSVVTIEDNAFAGCGSLDSVTIPGSVGYIGDSAFIACTLESAEFLGNAPTDVGIWIFGSPDPSGNYFRIFYHEGATGWTDPWNGYVAIMMDDTRTATFLNSDLSVYHVAEIRRGSLITLPDDPQMEDKVFRGWYTQDLKSIHDFDVLRLTENMTFYSGWMDKRIDAVSASAAMEGGVEISWASAEGADFYEVFFAAGSTDKYDVLQTGISKTVVVIGDTVLQKGLTYRFTVRAYASSGINDEHVYSDFSQAVTVDYFKPELISSAVLSVDRTKKLISGVSAGITTESFLSNLSSSADVTVYRGNTAVSSSELIGTGMIVRRKQGGNVIDELKIVVTGDLNGDGKLTLTDFVQLKSHIMAKTVLAGAYAAAADLNNDSRITLTDFVKTKARLMGTGATIR